MAENVEKIKEFIADKLGVEVSKLTDDARFVDDLGADSLDAVELFMQLEDEFCVEISESEAQNMQTVKDVIDFIQENQK